MSEAQAQAPAATPAGPKTSLLPLLLGVMNTLAILGALGLMIYTRVLFKHPKITEETERQRLAQLEEHPPSSGADLTTAQMNFESLTANIHAGPAPTPEETGKLHYVTLAFSIELRDSRRKDEAEELRLVFTDRLLSLLGRKEYHDLSTVQGRYMLRTEILDAINQLAEERQNQEGRTPAQKRWRDPLVSNVFFTQFLVQ